MMFKTASTERILPSPLLAAAADSHDDAPSTIVSPTVKSDGTEDVPLPLSTAPPPSDSTCTAQSVAASTAQPAIAPALYRAPERYQILNEHGRGGLGRVSRAYDRELGRDVAIKELISRTSIGEVRFLREAMITARLEHPGIVPLYEAGRWPDGTPYYAMKLVSGRSLRDLIAERTTVDQRIGLLHHVIAVADAIAYAHGRNVIHRDLKPANVIVGAFGETIVIDWGLAKDLSSSGEEITIASSPSHPPSSSDLTAAGAVLGTPSYMAPEQERGEHVDQRADVFAIGAMLWEICSLQKVPPTNLRLRHRLLRRAGIDHDLGVIIDKALAPDPRRRYPDAGALAADLKAFKSGARISARSYSLPATLAHWTRRHRTLTLSVNVVIGLAVAGGVLYVRNTTIERDRANTSEERARHSQISAEASLDELTLKHAQLLLTTDPSASIDALARYHGADVNRAAQIRADANGRGVARLRAVPHTNNVFWTKGTPEGGVISLSSDGTIARTSPDGTSRVLVRGVAQIGLSSYSPQASLLAYACDPSDVCLFDITHSITIATAPILRDSHPVGISFSPGGSLLSLMSKEGILTVLDVVNPSKPVLRLRKAIKGGIDVKFFEENIVAAGTVAGLEFVRIDGSSEPVIVPDSTFWDASASLHQFTLATTRGQAFVFEAFPLRLVASRTLCTGPIIGLQFIAGQRRIAYACREGSVGIWDLQRREVKVRIRVEGHCDLLTTSPAGDYILAGGTNGTAVVLDLVTDIVALYKGHGFRLTAMTSPSQDSPFTISADARGAIRVWPVRPRFARTVATSTSRFQVASFDQHSDRVTATTWEPSLTTFGPKTGVEQVKPHDAYNIFLEQSPTGNSFATYGPNDLIEIWSPATMTRSHLIPTGHGSVSQLRFVPGTDDFVTSGHDGRLLHWAAGGVSETILEIDRPIEHFAFVHASDHIVFSTAGGELWYSDNARTAVPLSKRGISINVLFTVPGYPTVLAGYANGDVIAINAKTWQEQAILHASGPVREIAATSDGRLLAIATNAGEVGIGELRNDYSGLQWLTRHSLSIRANHIVLAADGLLVAVCADGLVWLYHIFSQGWLCIPIGTGDVGYTAVSRSGHAAVVTDSEGRLTWIDLESARKLLDDQSVEH